MACPLCFTAAVMETSHTQSPLSPPGPTNMQDGNRTQIFHQGPFTSLPDHGPGPIRVLWGFCTGRCSMFSTHSRAHTDTRRPAVTAAEKMHFLTEPLRTAPFPQQPVSPSHNQEERRPETRTRLTVFSVVMMASFPVHSLSEVDLQLFGLQIPPSYECNLSLPPVELICSEEPRCNHFTLT